MNTALPSRPVVPTASPAAARARLARLLRKRRSGVIGLLVLTGAGSAASLAGPALIGRVVDAVSSGDGDARRVIDQTVLAYIAFVLLAAGLSYLAMITATRLAENTLTELRREVFDHTVALPIDFVEQVGTGELVSRATNDVQTLTEFTRRALPRLVFAGSEVALTLVALVVVDARIAAAALIVAVPVGYLSARWYFRHAPHRYRTERERAAALTARIHETYSGAHVLRLYRATRRHRKPVLHAGRQLVDANMATTAARNRFRSALQITQGVALVTALVVGTVLHQDDRITLGAVSAAVLYLARIVDPVTVVLEQVDALQRATASLARIVGVTQLPLTQQPVEITTPPVSSSDDTEVAIDIDHVTFAYTPGEPVLHDLTLQVRRGERIVIVGASGAGKTTLAKLLTRAHHPDNGNITLNGIPIDHYPPHRLSHTIALVVQDAHTFTRSIADNILLANPTLTTDQILETLEHVDATAWITGLPAGIDTIVGDGHVPLTTPQQQQLALARIIAANPDIVVLDEATADLDPIAANAAEHHLHTALAGRTVITIAHRLDITQHADRVALLDHGYLLAIDTHTNLLTTNASYQHLWTTWHSSKEGIAPTISTRHGG